MTAPTVFYPEPCANCEASEPCDMHDIQPTWGDDWLHPSERKNAPSA